MINNHPKLKAIRERLILKEPVPKGDGHRFKMTKDYRQDIPLLLAIIERQAEALAFYADENQYRHDWFDDTRSANNKITFVQKDEGETARQAQADIQKLLNGENSPGVEGE